MASLITSSEITNFTNALENHFDTFKINVKIYREGKKIVTSVNPGGIMYGFGTEQQKTNVTYVPDTGVVWEALVSIEDEDPFGTMGSISNLQREEGDVRLEVKREVRDFIQAQKVEKIEIHDKTFNLDSEEAPKDFLGLVYYVFKLKPTK